MGPHVDKSVMFGHAATVGTGLRFPEGPVALDDGSVLVVEVAGGALTRVRSNGGHELVADCGGGPNGGAFGPDGAVYVCNNGGLAFATEEDIRYPTALADTNEGGCLQRVDLSTSTADVVFTHCDGDRIGSLNDIVFDETGSCYVTDTTRGSLYYADPVAGSIEQMISGLECPNGVGLSPDGRRLYLSETYSGRVSAWDVVGPGVLSNGWVLRASAEGHGWDGLAVDGAGNICVANLERSGITVLAFDGTIRGHLRLPRTDRFVTNLCFGGADGRTAFICSSGLGILYSTRWPWPGLRLHFAR